MTLFDKKMLDKIGDSLKRASQTIAVAESVTSGLLQLAFSSAESATAFFQGGITAYNVAQKYKHLSVEPIHAIDCNCVSERTAAEMALNCCHLFQSDWGIGITGYATPVPESGNKIFAYYAIACRGDLCSGGEIQPGRNEAFSIQLFYTNYVLEKLHNIIIASPIA